MLISFPLAAMEMVKHELKKELKNVQASVTSLQLQAGSEATEYPLVKLDVNTNMTPVVNAVTTGLEKIKSMVPHKLSLNPFQLVPNISAPLTGLFGKLGGLLENSDVLMQIYNLILEDSGKSGYRNVVFLIRHLLATGAIIGHENVEFLVRLVEGCQEVLDERFVREIDKMNILAIIQGLGYQPDIKLKLYDQTNLDPNMRIAVQAAIQIANSTQILGMTIPLRTQSSLAPLEEQPKALNLNLLSTLFLKACREGEIDIVRDALMLYPSLINTINKQGFDPLFEAAYGYVKSGKEGVAEIFTYLLERNANPDLVLKIERKGATTSYHVYGTLREYVLNNGQKNRFDKLCGILKNHDEFIQKWCKWRESGKKEDEPKWLFNQEKLDELQKALYSADLDKIITLIDAHPRMTYSMFDDGLSLLHKVAACYLLPRIKKLQEKYKRLDDLFKKEKLDKLEAVHLYFKEKTKMVAPLYLKPEPKFWKHADARKIPLIIDEENEKFMKVWSYLLQVGVALDVKDDDGLTAHDYFVFVEQMENEFAQYEEEKIFLWKKALCDKALEEKIQLIKQNAKVDKRGILLTSDQQLELFLDKPRVTEEELRNILRGTIENEQQGEISDSSLLREIENAENEGAITINGWAKIKLGLDSKAQEALRDACQLVKAPTDPDMHVLTLTLGMTKRMKGKIAKQNGERLVVRDIQERRALPKQEDKGVKLIEHKTSDVLQIEGPKENLFTGDPIVPENTQQKSAGGNCIVQ